MHVAWFTPHSCPCLEWIALPSTRGNQPSSPSKGGPAVCVCKSKSQGKNTHLSDAQIAAAVHSFPLALYSVRDLLARSKSWIADSKMVSGHSLLTRFSRKPTSLVSAKSALGPPAQSDVEGRCS